MRFRRPIYRPLTGAALPGEPKLIKIPIATTCPDCDGRRAVMMQRPGRPETARLFRCETCGGEGEVIE